MKHANSIFSEFRMRLFNRKDARNAKDLLSIIVFIGDGRKTLPSGEEKVCDVPAGNERTNHGLGIGNLFAEIRRKLQIQNSNFQFSILPSSAECLLRAAGPPPLQSHSRKYHDQKYKGKRIR